MAIIEDGRKHAKNRENQCIKDRLPLKTKTFKVHLKVVYIDNLIKLMKLFDGFDVENQQ